jgi:hypothetical protein
MSIASEQAHPDGDDAGCQRADNGNELQRASDAGENESVRHVGRQKYRRPNEERDQSQQQERSDVLTQQEVEILGDAPPHPSMTCALEAALLVGGSAWTPSRPTGCCRAR